MWLAPLMVRFKDNLTQWALIKWSNEVFTIWSLNLQHQVFRKKIPNTLHPTSRVKYFTPLDQWFTYSLILDRSFGACSSLDQYFTSFLSLHIYINDTMPFYHLIWSTCFLPLDKWSKAFLSFIWLIICVSKRRKHNSHMLSNKNSHIQRRRRPSSNQDKTFQWELPLLTTKVRSHSLHISVFRLTIYFLFTIRSLIFIGFCHWITNLVFYTMRTMTCNFIVCWIKKLRLSHH